MDDRDVCVYCNLRIETASFSNGGAARYRDKACHTDANGEKCFLQARDKIIADLVDYIRLHAPQETAAESRMRFVIARTRPAFIQAVCKEYSRIFGETVYGAEGVLLRMFLERMELCLVAELRLTPPDEGNS